MPEKTPENLPKWLEMPDLLKKTAEEEELDDYVQMAGIIIKNENFKPLPPKSPRSPKIEKVSQKSQIPDEEEEIQVTPDTDQDQDIISANEINSQISQPPELMDYSQANLLLNANIATKMMNIHDVSSQEDEFETAY